LCRARRRARCDAHQRVASAAHAGLMTRPHVDLLPQMFCRRPSSWRIWERSTKRFTSLPEFLMRSEEHTSELQSRFDLVCRLLLQKKEHRIINVYNHRRCHYKLENNSSV